LKVIEVLIDVTLVDSGLIDVAKSFFEICPR
jgi:hypothetical protein